ncbi:MAG TPA: hypothetical protein VG838_04250 [Opitutaceae bacterium]|nr:hypothetical protein [Opitutaceae bacterium]
MKTSVSALVGLLAAAPILFLGSGCTSATNPTTAAAHAAWAAQPVRLQVAIIVPVSMNSIRDDDVVDTFGQNVRTALHQHGFKGRIKLLDESQRSDPSLPLLEVNLTEWRVDISGNVACTFGATLKTPSGEKGLGLFTGNSLLAWGRHDWTARADSFQDAAHDALDNLADRIEQTGLLSKAPM